MAIVEIIEDATAEPTGVARVVPLAATTTVGRSAAAPWTVTDGRMPTHWLELRWFPEEGWAFRYLEHAELSSARHRRQSDLPEGWFSLGVGHCVTHPAAKVKLVDGTPPNPIVVDVATGEVKDGEAMLALVEPRDDGTWPTDADAVPSRVAPLADGEIFTVGGRPYRFHDAVPPRSTEAPALDMAGRGVELHLTATAGECALVLTGGLREITLRSTKLRVLLPYFRERLAGDADGGWLSIHDVLDDLEGEATAPLRTARVGEYRGWIRYELTRRGVANAAQLFEKRKVGGPGYPGEGWLTRIRMHPSQILLDDSEEAPQIG